MEWKEFMDSWWPQIMVTGGVLFMVLRSIITFYRDMRRDTLAIKEMRGQCEWRTNEVSRRFDTMEGTLKRHEKILNDTNNKIAYIHGRLKNGTDVK